MTAEIDRAVENNLNGTRAIGVIAAFGLFMAMIGIYGVISCSVTERTHEMGVRLALGADRSQMLRLVIRQGMRHAGIGLVISLVLGGLTALGIRHSLFGIGLVDWVSYLGVCLVLLLTALAASWFPALRASKIDPMKALRNE